MKILYYNWIQFDNEQHRGGGVNVYQYNLIEYLINNTDNKVFFLSAGTKYNPLRKKPYIRETKNIFGNKCTTFEIINSPIMAPAFQTYMNPAKFNEDEESVAIFDKFMEQQGGFDIVHFNTIEGVSVNVLKLKEKYTNTKFIVSVHNYQMICPLNQYFQNHNECICNDFKGGKECLNCSVGFPSRKEYYFKIRDFYFDFFRPKSKLLKFPIKVFCKFFQHRTKSFIGSKETMIPEKYAEYRTHNIELLNKYADCVLAVSDRVGKIMIYNGCNPEKVKLSYIGTKFAEKQIGHSVAERKEMFTIAYLGYERIDKGFFFLINVLSKLDEKIAKKINVVLAVANLHDENVEKLTMFNKIITYKGYTHDKLPEILKDVNLGIVPVLWEDNLPQVAIEMVALGVPILASDFGGASELCGSDLFKFRGGDENDFLEKLTSIVKEPQLLDEYWAHHRKLTTMAEHYEDLRQCYIRKTGVLENG